MRRLIIILLIIASVVLAASFSIKPLILFIAKQQLSGVFPESQILIGKCSFLPHRLLIFSDLEIKRGKIYDFKIKKAEVSYSPFGLLRRNISRFYLGETSISIDLGQKSITGLAKYLNLKPSIFLLKAVELSGLNLDLKSRELTLSAKVSSQIDPTEQSLNSLYLKIDALEAQGGARLENLFLSLHRDAPGELRISRIQFDKAKILEVKGKTRIDRKTFLLDSLSADAFDGKIEGDLSINLEKIPEYLCNLKFVNLDVDRFVQDFKLREKFQGSGKLSGDLALKGSGADIKILSGDFSAVEPGGRLTITDDKFLKNMAQSSGESLDILVESFKDYHYNTGIVKLSLEQGNLIFDIALEGEAGKRNLTIILHNFKLGSLASGD